MLRLRRALPPATALARLTRTRCAARVEAGRGGCRAGVRAAADVQGARCTRGARQHATRLTQPFPLSAPLQAHREQLTQLLFEQFNVAGLYVADAPVLALYATGKLTGSVIDIGAEKIGAPPLRAAACMLRSVTRSDAYCHADICPVFEGAPFSPGARRLEFGGRDIDAHLQQLLRARRVLARAARSCKCALTLRTFCFAQRRGG